jgi:putative ABC transport system permease protein
VFRGLLHLYPASFREEYGKELSLVLVDRLRAEPRALTRGLVVIGALVGILGDAPRQHLSWLVQDLRMAARSMRREKWFAAVAVTTIALGLGLASAVFSVAKTLLIDPPPYPEADRAVMVWVTNPRQGYDRDYTSYPRLLDWRAGSVLIESFAAFTFRQVVMTGVGEPEQLRAAAVSPELFDVVRTTPLAGRLFSADEEQAHVVVLSHGVWQRRFGGDPQVIGRTLRLDLIPYTIVGVLPPAYQFPDRDVDAWVPLQPGPQERSQRGPFWLRCVGRLAAGVSAAQAEQEMNALARRLATEHPVDRDLGVALVGLHEEMAGPFRPALLLLTAAVVGVLLIACANVAGMLTARGAARQREVAIRTALGAATRRVVRQLLTEAVTLFAAGGVVGVALAWITLRMLILAAPSGLARLQDVSLDVPMMVVGLGMALLTGLLFGVFPSWQATRYDVTGALGFGAKGTVRGVVSQRFRRVLLVGQVAVATIVLSASALFVRSLVHVQRVDLGFEPRDVLTARLALSKRPSLDAAARARFFDRLLERVRVMPGVTSAAAASSMLGPANSSSFTLEGRSEMVDLPLTFDAVTPEFFRVLQIPLLRGRLFSNDDRADGPLVAIVNETTAQKHWPNVDPIGKRFNFGAPQGTTAPWLTVVGVVADTRRSGVDRPVRPESYQPHTQSEQTASMLVLVRTASDPGSIVPMLRAAVHDLDPDQPLARVATLDQLLDERTAARRFNTWLLGVFGAAAVALTAIGLYGLVAYLVVLRRQEMAVRMAIGATPRDVLALVVRNIAVIVGAGLMLGLAGIAAIAPWLRGLLFEVQPADPWSQAGVLLILLTVAFVAAWIPARRAMRIDPVTALWMP